LYELLRPIFILNRHWVSLQLHTCELPKDGLARGSFSFERVLPVLHRSFVRVVICIREIDKLDTRIEVTSLAWLERGYGRLTGYVLG